MTRGQAREEVQSPVTEDGSDRKFGADVKKKMKEVAKKSTRARKKTRIAATEDGKSSKSGRGDVCVETSKGAG